MNEFKIQPLLLHSTGVFYITGSILSMLQLFKSTSGGVCTVSMVGVIRVNFNKDKRRLSLLLILEQL